MHNLTGFAIQEIYMQCECDDPNSCECTREWLQRKKEEMNCASSSFGGQSSQRACSVNGYSWYPAVPILMCGGTVILCTIAALRQGYRIMTTKEHKPYASFLVYVGCAAALTGVTYYLISHK
jgi:hypothetical protein